MMRISSVVCGVAMWLVGCGTPGPDGAGDAGLVDAGAPACRNLNSGVTAVSCVELQVFANGGCGATASEARAKQPRCDGGVSEASCGAGLQTVSYVYGPFGDVYRCYFEPDGGALVGAVNFSDRGPVVAGTVSACAAPEPMCP